MMLDILYIGFCVYDCIWKACVKMHDLLYDMGKNVSNEIGFWSYNVLNSDIQWH